MRAADWLLPGVGHVRHGFRREARKYMLFMGVWLAVMVLRWERVRGIAHVALGWDKPGLFWWVLGLAFVGSAVWAWRRGAWRTLSGFWAVALPTITLFGLYLPFLMSGTIIESDGETLELQIRAIPVLRR